MLRLKFLHTGSLGDIIYSLPFCRMVVKSHDCDSFDFAIVYNAPLILSQGYKHPAGNVMVTEDGAKMLRELLIKQPYINECLLLDYKKGLPSDYNNLSQFRKLPVYFDRGDITRWYEPLFNKVGSSIDSFNPWLTAKVRKEFKDKIVLVRSSRYRNPTLDYRPLKVLSDRLLFLGVESELKDMERILGHNVDYAVIKDFYEAACIINSCKIGIFNQTGLMSIAEGLKSPRIMEVCPTCPNVISSGGVHHSIHTQIQLNALVEQIAKS